MYEFPFGAGQQLNLNWIINEIITLHKQLDPDYELPNFDTAFPYMNLNTLNLDWILRELKAIKDLAPTEDAQLLKMVANALIANTYDAETQYNVDDIVYRDSEKRLFKCVTATPAGGEPFDNSKWVEVDVGEVLTGLLVNGATANAVTNVRYNDHKIQQEINGTYSDVIVIEDTPTDVSDRLPSSKAVYNLNGAINNVQGQITAYVQTSTTATRKYEKGDYLVLNGVLYYVKTTINNGGTITPNTNVVATTIGEEIGISTYNATDLFTDNITVQLFKSGHFAEINSYVNTATGVSLSTGWRTLFVIPQEIRPTIQLRMPIINYLNGNIYQGRINNSTGEVQVYIPSTETFLSTFVFVYLL